MMTKKQKWIFVAIGIAGVWGVIIIIGVIIGVIAHIATDDFTLEDLKNLRNRVAYEKEEAGKDTGDGPCGIDCYMLLSDVEEKLGMSNKGTCVSLCWNGREEIIDTGSEDCVQYTGGVCRYDKKIGRKMYAITVKYSSWEGQSGAESMDWEEIDD
jgi:hypothetical protein